jgi:hypothetical protein
MSKQTHQSKAKLKKQKRREQVYGGKIPKDYLLAHNQVAHTAKTTNGVRGFRYFWIPPEWDWVECQCGWRPERGPHYRRPDGDTPVLLDEEDDDGFD